MLLAGSGNGRKAMTNIKIHDANGKRIYPRKKKSRLVIAFNRLVSSGDVNGCVSVNEGVYYNYVSEGKVVGHVTANMVAPRGIPTKNMMSLIFAGSRPVKFMWEEFYWGLVWKIPYVVGKKATKCRLTKAGLAFVDDAAKHSKVIEALVKTTITAKHRKEINDACSLLYFGQLPQVIIDAIEQNEKEMSKLKISEKG